MDKKDTNQALMAACAVGALAYFNKPAQSFMQKHTPTLMLGLAMLGIVSEGMLAPIKLEVSQNKSNIQKSIEVGVSKDSIDTILLRIEQNSKFMNTLPSTFVNKSDLAGILVNVTQNAKFIADTRKTATVNSKDAVELRGLYTQMSSSLTSLSKDMTELRKFDAKAAMADLRGLMIDYGRQIRELNKRG